MDTVWSEADRFCAAEKQWQPMLDLLQLQRSELKMTCDKRAAGEFESNFMYVKRQVVPLLAEQVKALNIPGVHLQRDYKRFLSAGARGRVI